MNILLINTMKMNLTNMATKQQLQQKSNKHFQQDSDQVISFNYTLAAILRGENINENK